MKFFVICGIWTNKFHFISFHYKTNLKVYITCCKRSRSPWNLFWHQKIYCYKLKALFYTVEARFKSCWTLMSVLYAVYRWIINSPAGIQFFWNWCDHYQDIYDWISPLNKPSGLWFILTQQSTGGNECGKSSHLSILSQYNGAFEVQFFKGFIFTPHQRHW